MSGFLMELHRAVRSLRRSRGLTIVSVLALTLGIGLTTTVFSIIYGAFEKGLPFPEGHRIVQVVRDNPQQDLTNAGLPIHDFMDVRAQQRSFSAVAAYYNGTVNLSGRERAERFDGAFVTPNLFDVLGVHPILGRGFRDADDQPGAARVAVIGNAMWRNRYGGDTLVVGTSIRINGQPATIIGVMPPGFLFPEQEEIWLPLGIDPLRVERGGGLWLNVVGRLRPDVSLDQASADVAAIARRLATAYPKTNEGMRASVVSYVDAAIGREPRRLLNTMLGAVFLVLLIACANVANLLLDRAVNRTKEQGVRTALGASRWAVARQSLAEATVFCATGAVLGVGLAQGGIALFNRAIVQSQPPFFIDIRLHPPVLLFTLAVTLIAAIASGALPALRTWRTDVAEVLKDESRGSSGFRVGRLSRSLVVVEIALSCALLVAAGLTIKTIVTLRTMDHGIRTRGIFTARAGFPATYTDTLAQDRFFDELATRLEELPGAQAATISSGLPATTVGNGSGPFAIEGRAYGSDRDYPRVNTMTVTPGFFAVFDLPAREGRLLAAQDRRGSAPVVVVNEQMAQRFFPGESPLGRRIRVGGATSTEPWMTIVGVVPDVQTQDNDEPRPPMLFQPLAQHHTSFASIAVLARDAEHPMSLTTSVRDAVASLDPDIPLYWLYSLDETIARSSWFYRVFGTMFMLFGGIALFLASIGLYAVMALSVARRTRELGIRMALGAGRGSVIGLVVRQSTWQLAIGLVAGLGIAAALSHLLAIILFGVQPRDPLIFGGVVLLLGVTAALAALVPARRATRVDPMVALRFE
ncbi:MAG TPA: ABC transporter permease [Gemmatimonadaceae bacterium]|nr:ABC transporter permease [Gemmatimonadaceae bacterium]